MRAPRSHRALRALGALLGTAVAAGAVTSGTFAAFLAKGASTGNRVNAAADWVGPSVVRTTLWKQTHGDGAIRQGGTYRIYAQVVDDTGSPPSGLSTVTANPSAITTGTTSATLSSGTYTVNGQSYNRRSAQLTATTPQAEGAKTFTVTARDVATNITNKTGAVLVDNTPPATVDVQAANRAGGVAGRAETGDTITYTFSERPEPGSILAGFTGDPLAVTARLNQATGGDTVTVWNAANATQTRIGTVNLGDTAYTTTSRTFTGSTIALSATAPWTLTLTLGTPSGAVGTAATARTATWTPLTNIVDVAGNALPTTARSESGAADVNL